MHSSACFSGRLPCPSTHGAHLGIYVNKKSVWSRAISENQPRENTSGGTTYEHSSRLYASSVASGAGVSSSGAEAASELDEIDVLTPRRSFNRLIKGAHLLPELRAVILDHTLDFDAANLAHALGRVAKLYRSASQRGGLETASSDRRWNKLQEAAIPAVQRLCEQLPRLVMEMEAWDVAQSLWALSILDCYDRRVFEMLCQRGSQIADLLKPADCCMIMLAFGRFGHYSPELIRYIPQVMLQELDKAKPVEVSNVLWGLAKLKLPSTPTSKVFLEAINDHMMWTMDQYPCEELTRSLWSLATLSHYPGKRFLWTAESQLLERVALMTPQDVGNVLWSFGRFKYKPVRLLDELPLHIGRRLSEFKPQELSCLLYGYAQSRHYHASLLDAAAPIIMIRAPQMSHQDLVITLWCYGIFGHKPTLSGPAVTAALRDTRASPSSDRQPSYSSSSSSSWSSRHPSSTMNHPIAAVVGTSGSTDSSSPSSGLSSFIDAIGSVIFRRMPELEPLGLSNVIKALGGLKSPPTKPEIQALAREAATIASSRIHEFKFLEMSNLLYGLSLMQYNDPVIYQQCIQQSILLLEQKQDPVDQSVSRWGEGWMVRNQSWNDQAPVDFSPGQSYPSNPLASSSTPRPTIPYQLKSFDHKTINSIVASCVSVGITPSDLIEVAEMRGLRVRDPSSYRKVPRGQQGHPPFSSSKYAKRVQDQPRDTGEAPQEGRTEGTGSESALRGSGISSSAGGASIGSDQGSQVNARSLKIHIVPPAAAHSHAATVAPSDSVT